MITESPDRIRVSPRWSSVRLPIRCSQRASISSDVASLSESSGGLLFSSTIFRIDCNTKYRICKVLFIFRSNICISCHFRMDMDRYVQLFYRLRQYRTFSAPDKVVSWSLCRRSRSTVEARTASLLSHPPCFCIISLYQMQDLPWYPLPWYRLGLVLPDCR